MGSPRFLLLAAMPEERQPFLDGADDVGPTDAAFAGSRALTEVVIGGVPGQILVTGIGPVAAASALGAYLSNRPAPGLIVSVGSAGGLHREVALGSVIVGSQYRYADVDARAFGYEYGQVPGMPARFESSAAGAVPAGGHVHHGLLLTSSSFVSAALAEPIQAQFPQALAVDMESAALAQTCYLFGHDAFVSVRGISDLCTPRAGADFHDGLGVAATRSYEITHALLTSA